MIKTIRRIVFKVASYTIVFPFDQPFQEFTNAGATGAIVFTLPAPKVGLQGVSYRFRGVADYAITVQSATAGDIVTKNDAAANSVAASTAGELIGALIEAICIRTADGVYKWAVSGLAVGHTYTVAT